MESEKYLCPFCGKEVKKSNPYHIKQCEEFKNFLIEKKEEFIEKYTKNEYSVLELSSYYNVPYTIIKRMIKTYGLKIRTLKESKNTQRVKEKYESTMMEHFGCKHNFDKECESRKKWEKRLLETEGITNVFQRKDVIEKIKKTLREKYTEEEIYQNYAKGSTLQYWIDKLGEEEGTKEYKRICYQKGNSNRLSYYKEIYGDKEGEIIFKNRIHNIISKNAKSYHTSINERFNKILIENNIPFKREFVIHKKDKTGYFSYDFLINNTLIVELNGEFWHADPRKYKKNDVLSFPGRKVIAEDLWEKDKLKCNLAKENGYKVLTIWEDDINRMTDEEILKCIEYGKG